MHSVDCAQASLQEQRHCRSSGSCWAELWLGPGSRPGSAGALGSHGEHLCLAMPLSAQWKAEAAIASGLYPAMAESAFAGMDHGSALLNILGRMTYYIAQSPHANAI